MNHLSQSSSDPYHIHALLLAAGESKRFGGPKQLAQIQNHALILRTLTQFNAAEFNTLSLVLGARAEEIKKVLPADANVVIAEHWQQGMGNSIAKGVENLPEDSTHVFIGLADQVEIYTKQCNLLVEQSKKQRTKIVASKYMGRRGAPAIFPRHVFSQLIKLNTDRGARDLLENTRDVVEVDIPEAAIDIDTRIELNAYLATLASSHK
jgi:molybdenum cofactor cytidylyltransferase